MILKIIRVIILIIQWKFLILILGLFYLWHFIKNYFYDSIPLRIRFDKIDGFIKIFDGIRYLVLFSYLYDKICNRIKYLVSEKSGITDSISYNFTNIKIDSYNSLPTEIILAFHW